MKDCVGLIYEKLNNDIPVVLYTAGGNTLSIIRCLKERFGVLPTAVCDGDPEKQGRTFRGLENLIVLSPDEAISNYPDGEFFITSLPYKFDIIGYLISKSKLSPERIINYEPVVWRKSCIYMEKFVKTLPDYGLAFCCGSSYPYVDFNEDFSFIKDFADYRDSLIKRCADNNFEDVCKKCGLINEGWRPVNPKINNINYFTGGACNYKCIYCQSHVHDDEYKDNQFIGLDKLIMEFSKNNMLADYYNIDLLTAGEVTVHPKRKELFAALNTYSNVVSTNSYKFDKDLYQQMNEKPIRLFVSIDAGTRETYKKIKSVDGFDKVRENLKKYADSKCGLVTLKYIFLPGINDKAEEIDGFVQLCEDTNAVTGIISYDFFAELPIPENTLEMMRRLKINLEKRNILCIPFNTSVRGDFNEAVKNVLKG